MEVVVTFLGGDPDRPLVTGCVVNATHPPPFELPEAAAVSGIRTRSTPASQGFNELRFDDRAGLEVLATHAERDHHEVVGRDRAARVARDRSDEIGGSASTHVRGDASLRVEGAHAEQIGGGASTQVGGDRAIAVGGALSLEVGAGARARVGGDSTVDVRGRSSFVVGSAEEPGNREDYVFGRASLGASEALVLRSETSILLQCGDASVELLPGRITLRAPQIDVRAKERLRARAEDGPVVTLGEEVEVLASALRVFTDGAALELDEDAKLKGAQIKLGYDPSKPSRSDDDPPPETKPFRCKLSDYYLHPYARRRFHLVAQGLRFEGETDDEGVVAAEIPADTRQVSIRLWIGAYPEGRQRLYDLRVEELPPLAELRGVQARLKNLGYFTGPADGEESAALTKAVAEFQEDHRQSHDLQPTGALDEGTRGALEEIHGH